MNIPFWKEKWQVLKFNIVGLLNTAIDVGAFTLLTGLGVSVIFAQPAGYGLGLLNSYIFNKRWTFRTDIGQSQSSETTGTIEQHLDGTDGARSSGKNEVTKFLLVNLITFGLNSLILWGCYDLAGMHEWLSKCIATVVTLAANYLGYSRWVFKS